MSTPVGAAAAGLATSRGWSPRARSARWCRRWRVQEARRLMLHPLTLRRLRDLRRQRRRRRCSGDQGPRSAFETANMVLTFYPGCC